ncbi:3-hydroxyisobutyryl-CoA hydrolase, mitochondrial-like [Aphidius gifuensis]|uniref:3-hydroxyisobutyryl-CoA hydrolase, mitochondrial-like n=1 Tax=Aphidius gifuensis TaxID=684658 RepID=UPI001CDD0256|nr:3-hydroxyisobutyryl-CoA hydrolase, mitochondrial-like [Aphidius gifuensis]
MVQAVSFHVTANSAQNYSTTTISSINNSCLQPLHQLNLKEIVRNDHCYDEKKVLVPQKLSQRQIVEKEDVKEFGDKGLITLNKPQAMNTLTGSMLKKINEVLRQWESTKQIVMIKGADEKVFCAGGDIKKISFDLSKPGGTEIVRDAFRQLYISSHLVGTFKKPYVAIINGIVMGGGAGLSIHGKYRVSTETTVFAMPETRIGYYPNAGATYFLPRMNGQLGFYLGLTGYKLKGRDIKLTGISTHHVSSSRLKELNEVLLAPGVVDVGKILDKFDEHDSTAELSLADHSKQIAYCFSGDTVEEIIKRLKEDNSTWAQSVIETLEGLSPTGLKITLEIFKRGKTMSFAECLKMEYVVDCNLVKNESDFEEGVRALLIDKDLLPVWNPKTLAEVTNEYIYNHFQPICLIDIPIGSFKCIYAGKLLLIKQGANEGGDYGDEYFAILNYVEVVEAMKANEEEL